MLSTSALESGSSTATEESVNCTFLQLNLNDWLVRQCSAIGITKPTPVQYHCIPQILKGIDCIGCSKTGTGKTAAFALPILQMLCEDPYGVFALILTPTRELAFQISDQFDVLGKPIGLKVTVVIGGMDMVKQGSELSKKPHVVVATPGRLADHVLSGNGKNFRKIKFLVLDEADRLLDSENFAEQLQTIFSVLPKQRQTLLFSATITDRLEKLRQIALHKPFFWTANVDVATVNELNQRYVLVPQHVKDGYLVHVIQEFQTENPNKSCMVFVQTCREAQSLSMALIELGFPSVALHSLIRQRERLAALTKFKSNQVHILVATDVASRGLDIPEVDLVVNHNVPSVPKDYIHRVGRTARAGRGGLAVTLVTQYDVKRVHAIENLIKTKLTEHKTNESAVLRMLTEVNVARREAEIRMDEMDMGENKKTNKRKKLILEGKDPDEEQKATKKKMKQKEKKKRRQRETKGEKEKEAKAAQ